MNKQVFELTSEKVSELNEELNHYKTVLRPLNIEAIKEARAQGDLSENADYDAAREEQGRIESRIVEIENILKNVKIIKKDDSKYVAVGKEVTFEYTDCETNTTKTFNYHLVGTIEADPFNNKISNESPVGKSIIGKTIGDIVKGKNINNKEFQIIILDVK